MRPLKIAVYLNENYEPSAGGGYSYQQRLLRAIDTFPFTSALALSFVSLQPLSNNNFTKPVYVLKKPRAFKFKVMKFAASLFYYLTFKNVYLGSQVRAMKTAYYIAQLKALHIDLIYFLSKEPWFDNYPFIFSHWDIGHRTLFPFPEVAMNTAYEKREDFYIHYLNKAFLILTESEVGKQELLNYYHFNPAKIKVLPVFAGGVVEMVQSEAQVQRYLQQQGLQSKQFFSIRHNFGVIKTTTISFKHSKNS